MLRINTLLLMAAAAIFLGSNCNAQDCSACGNTFGYPASGGDGSGYGHADGSHPKLDYMKEVNAKVMARNDAWPKPFDCADRQLYFTMWTAMIDNGFEEQCILTSAHFDPQTNELNSFGLHTVAGIMQNMPSTRKQVFIHRDVDAAVSEARYNSVDSIVKTYYGQVAPNAQIGFSNKMPASVPGFRAETIAKLYTEGAPAPIIKVSSGNDSVQKAVNK